MTAKDDTKTCHKCKEVKPVAEFSKDKSSKDGLQGKCKACRRAYHEANRPAVLVKLKMYYEEHREAISEKSKEHYALNKDRILEAGKESYLRDRINRLAKAKAYVIEHKQEVAEYQKRYYEEHRSELLAYQSAYQCDNKERLRISSTLYYENNIDSISEYMRNYGKTHREEGNRRTNKWRKSHRGAHAARIMVRYAAKLQAKPIWFEKERYEIEAIYIESRRLSYETGIPQHVDHTVPLQSKEVCGLHCLSNLQIITASENLSKGNRYWYGQEWIIHKPT
jgi:hypothetical protein